MAMVMAIVPLSSIYIAEKCCFLVYFTQMLGKFHYLLVTFGAFGINSAIKSA